MWPIFFNVYMDGLSVLTLADKLDTFSLTIYVMQMICV